MHVHLIAALSQNRVIGIDGELPWRLKDDLKLFKSLTVNRTVLMGRKTFESIGRPLPHREIGSLLESDDVNQVFGVSKVLKLPSVLIKTASR